MTAPCPGRGSMGTCASSVSTRRDHCSTSTTTRSAADAQQARRQPSQISFSLSASRMAAVTGTSPASTRTLHPPQALSPPQGNSTPAAKSWSASVRCVWGWSSSFTSRYLQALTPLPDRHRAFRATRSLRCGVRRKCAPYRSRLYLHHTSVVAGHDALTRFGDNKFRFRPFALDHASQPG